MQVVLNDQGKYTLVAETEHDNTLLFTIVNGVTTNGVTFRFPQLKSKKGWSVRDLFSRKTRDEAVSVAMATEAMNRIQQAIKLEPEPAPEPEPEPKKGRGQYDRSKMKKRGSYTTTTKKPKRTTYTKTCPVIDCEHKGKSMKLHMKLAHGIQIDGSIKDTFVYNGARRSDPDADPIRPVTSPVVQLGNGKYRVRQTKGLLDD